MSNSPFFIMCAADVLIWLLCCVCCEQKSCCNHRINPLFFIEVSILTAVFISAMGPKRCSYKVVCASEICWMLLQAIHKETQQQGRFHVGVRARWEEPLQTHGGFSPTTKPRRSNLWHSNMSDTCTHHLGSHPDNLTDATREEILSEEDQKDSRACCIPHFKKKEPRARQNRMPCIDPRGVFAFKLGNKSSVSLPSGREYKFQRRKSIALNHFQNTRANAELLLKASGRERERLLSKKVQRKELPDGRTVGWRALFGLQLKQRGQSRCCHFCGWLDLLAGFSPVSGGWTANSIKHKCRSNTSSQVVWMTPLTTCYTEHLFTHIPLLWLSFKVSVKS